MGYIGAHLHLTLIMILIFIASIKDLSPHTWSSAFVDYKVIWVVEKSKFHGDNLTHPLFCPPPLSVRHHSIHPCFEAKRGETSKNSHRKKREMPLFSLWREKKRSKSQSLPLAEGKKCQIRKMWRAIFGKSLKKNSHGKFFDLHVPLLSYLFRLSLSFSDGKFNLNWK